MSTATVESSAPSIPKARRYIIFRVVAVVIAVIFIVVFGVWQSILTPWMTIPDSGEHGWERTPELHRFADAASALLMGAVAVAAITLAVRPAGKAALTLWSAGTLALIGIGSFVSSFLQGQDPMGAIMFTVVWLGILVVPFILFSPEWRSLLRPGTVNTDDGPSRPLRAALAVLAVAGLALAIGVIGWRIAGGLFQNPLEDDAVSLAMLGISLAAGAMLCIKRRQGWRTLAIVLAGMTAYAVIAGISVAVS